MFFDQSGEERVPLLKTGIDKIADKNSVECTIRTLCDFGLKNYGTMVVPPNWVGFYCGRFIGKSSKQDASSIDPRCSQTLWISLTESSQESLVERSTLFLINAIWVDKQKGTSLRS